MIRPLVVATRDQAIRAHVAFLPVPVHLCDNLDDIPKAVCDAGLNSLIAIGADVAAGYRGPRLPYEVTLLYTDASGLDWAAFEWLEPFWAMHLPDDLANLTLRLDPRDVA